MHHTTYMAHMTQLIQKYERETAVVLYNWRDSKELVGQGTDSCVGRRSLGKGAVCYYRPELCCLLLDFVSETQVLASVTSLSDLSFLDMGYKPYFFLILSWTLSVNFPLDNACGSFCDFPLRKAV